MATSASGSGAIGALVLNPIYESETVAKDKNTAKVLIVVYPSDSSCTKFLPQTSRKPEACGFGICVEPRKRTKVRWWSEKEGPEPALFTVEDYGEDELTIRTGRDIGSTGILMRIVIGEADEMADLCDYVDCIAPLIKEGKQRADINWAMACVKALQQHGLTQKFDLDDFSDFLCTVTEEQATAKVTSVKNFDYLERRRAINSLERMNSRTMPQSRRGSLANAMKDKLKRPSLVARVSGNVLKLN